MQIYKLLADTTQTNTFMRRYVVNFIQSEFLKNGPYLLIADVWVGGQIDVKCVSTLPPITHLNQ